MFSQYSEKCGKLLFLNQADADVKIIEREADKNNGWRGKSYQCQRCKHWHISTMVESDVDNKKLEESRIRNIDKTQRKAQIEAEKLAELKHEEKIKKIKEDNYELRKLAKLQMNEGTTKNKPLVKPHKINNDVSSKDKNRVVDSFGDNSKNSILNNLDSETLAKLKKKLL